MKKDVKYALSLISRYLILIVLGILGLSLFHLIFLPLTIYPVFLLLGSFFKTSIISNIIFVNNLPIEIIGSCVAGSAYSLLLILNLSTPKINFKKRILILFFSFSLLLLLNILRIFFLSALLISGNSLFDITHKIFWYAGSTIFVAGIWFLSVKLFKIKEIPFYSDIKSLYSLGKNSHNSKRSKKH